MIGTFPLGGVFWDYVQYALGLERLGFEVYYLEDSDTPAYDPRRGEYSDAGDYAAGFLSTWLDWVSPSLGRRWAYRGADGVLHGPVAGELTDIAAETDLFLNVSGACTLRDEYLPARHKVLIDTDPGWNQFVILPRLDRLGSLPGARSWRSHDHFFTYAERLGAPGCSLPGMGVEWRGTRPPVVTDRWRRRGPGETWTTVLTWNNYEEPIEHDGRTYGSKEVELHHVRDLPGRLPFRFEMAMGGVRPPKDEYRRLGWSVVDSVAVSVTPDDYRGYVESSRGEMSVAKNVYVATKSGWFSSRSVCYLAAGRPVVLQDTGFSELIGAGQGLVAFSDACGAAAAVEQVEEDYEDHSRAAVELARSTFSSDVVLTDLLGRIGLG